MTHTRLYVAEAIAEGQAIELSAEQARHVGRVLRAKPGDPLHLFNARDGEWRATVEAIGKSSLRVHIDSPLPVETESPLRIHLVQGVSRGDRMDFVVQKATELGVQRITPVLTDHGMVRLDAKRAAKRQAHWTGVAISATEQCGRIDPPAIDEPVSLNDWFGQALSLDAARLILDPRAATPISAIDTGTAAVCLLIGPEGGFSPREYDDARAAGFACVAMGPRILRTETAAIAALTLVQARCGDLQA